jgi:hypothetical protein
MELDYINDALDYAEENVLFSAELFLSGVQDWNQDKQVANVCHVCDFDEDFVWLACRVLFADAVRWVAMGGTNTNGEFL